MSAPTSQRIFWLDAAKAYGMFLVYYGHIVERFYQHGDNHAALLQDRLVYSFHMPLFFFISGFFARPDPPVLGSFVRKGLLARLLPAFFLSLLILPGLAIEYALPPDSSHYSAQFRAGWFDDWPDVCRRLSSTEEDAQARARAELWQALSAEVQAAVQAGAQADSLTQAQQTVVLDGLNAAMARPLYDLTDSTYIFHDRFVRHTLKDGVDTLSTENRSKVNVSLTFAALFPEWQDDESIWVNLWNDIARFYPSGFPPNVPTWFLIALLVVEIYHFLLGRFLHSTGRLLIAIPLFMAVGVYINHEVELWSDVFFARECVLLYAFYLLGLLLRRTQLLDRLSPLAKSAVLLASGGILLGTFNLNPGAPSIMPVVLINLSQHGHPYYFVITALAGCIAVSGLSLLTPSWKWISWIGRNTLLLMGINGFFFAFVNSALAGAMTVDDSQPAVLFWMTSFTVGSMLVSVPFALLLNHYVPQLVGRPGVEGPLLPKLM